MASVSNEVANMMSAQSGDGEDGYEDFAALIRSRFTAATADAPPLFTTDATGLFDAFLAALPAGRRQHYTCNACRKFIDRFGGLVTIAPDGTKTPVMWGPVPKICTPALFNDAVNAVCIKIGKAQVDGVFFCEEKTWGLPQNRSAVSPYLWHHMHVVPDARLVYRPTALRTADQVAAEKLEDYRILRRSLADFGVDVARQANALAQEDVLYRVEKVRGVAEWFLSLHQAVAAAKGKPNKDRVVWLAVAKAPPGWCHVRSSMIGTLLEDLASGMVVSTVRERFAAKMHSLKYQRAQVAPTAGNVTRAEKIVSELASSGALARRFARVEEVEALWRPARTAIPEASQGGGVFSHLRTKDEVPATVIDLPQQTMTWVKFRDTVLPRAERIDFQAPYGNESFSALVTAVNPDAPPILQWDREDRRNPFSFYLYVGGAPASDWNLRAGEWRAVTAVTLNPPKWGDRPLEHHNDGAFFLLEGARDLRAARGGKGGGFFPDCLRAEYHEVRATMEAFANSAAIAGGDQATACGIGLLKGPRVWNYLFRVTSQGSRAIYKLDRWD